MSVPVTILTGFLGSGKTTVLQKILAQENYGDTAVLVNEFGEVGIDQQLVAPIAPNVVLLDSGCLCCQIRGELKEALTGLLDARAQKSVPPFKRIVIETTGLAEPTPIIATIQADPMLTHQLAVARTITVRAPKRIPSRAATWDEEKNPSALTAKASENCVGVRPKASA